MGHGERQSHLPPRKWTTTTKTLCKGKSGDVRGGKRKQASKRVDEDSSCPGNGCEKRAVTLCESLAVSLCVLKDQGGAGTGVQNVQELIDILNDKMFDIKILRSRLRCLEDCEKILENILQRTLRD